MAQPSPETSLKRALRYLRQHRMKEAARLLRQCELKVDPVVDGTGELTGWNVRLRCGDEAFHQLKVWEGGAHRWRHLDPMQKVDAALKAVVPGTRSVDAEWVDASEVTWKIQVHRKRGSHRGERARTGSKQQTPGGKQAPANTPRTETAEGQTERITTKEASRLFALVKALDGEGGKPPSALTVFRLYCVENLSAEQVQRRCKCGKGTVLNRLNKLRKVTGMNPRAMRAMSAHFERIEEELSDSRARRIRRESAMDQPEEEDGPES